MMPHQRDRHIDAVIVKEMTHSPCLGILGMRQVGKSTLLKKFSNSYYSFDQPDFSIQFQRNSALLESSERPLALDEIQKYPPAFDALKYAIDQNKRPGQFLVSGSVRFSSKKQIRESLTGRISLIEVFPLTMAECHGKALSRFLQVLVEKSPKVWGGILEKNAWALTGQIQHYAVAGGLPGICFKRDESVRASQFENHIDTLLGRDIHMVYQTQTSLDQAKIIVTEIANTCGLPINNAHLARLAGLSQPTVKKLLLALEGIFLLRHYGSAYFLEDCGLSKHLVPLRGALSKWDWIHLIYHEFRVQLAIALRLKANVRPYTTRGGVAVPFLLDAKNGRKIAFCVDPNKTPTQKSLKSLSWCRKNHPDIHQVILSAAESYRILDSGIHIIPLNWVF